MNPDTRRRALAGDFGEDAQRLALGEITSSIPDGDSLLTPRQKLTAIVVTGLFIALFIGLLVARLWLPASLARKVAGS